MRLLKEEDKNAESEVTTTENQEGPAAATAIFCYEKKNGWRWKVMMLRRSASVWSDSTDDGPELLSYYTSTNTRNG